MILPDTMLEGRNGNLMYLMAQVALRYTLGMALAGCIAAAYLDGGWHLFALILAGAHIVMSLFASMAINGIRRSQNAERAAHVDTMSATQERVEELFSMTATLQSADSNADAAQVLRASSRRLLSGCGVALYVFNNSRDRLDLVDSWDLPEGYAPSPSLVPANCWALKRGKDHLNDPVGQTLCCSHYVGDVASIEVPMLARGSVYGLLVIVDRMNGVGCVENARRVARALADSTSLALSNISLREQLRTQSLRDPMTGLYNRRYMEDTLERFVALASRKNMSTSVLMIDLDNFKALNDQHGHAKGDAVLKDVASQVVGALRPSDVVCRYGGEELLVILPECTLDEATKRAEQVRARIEAVSEPLGCHVTASIGVSTLPDSANSITDLLASADAALYEAKAAGKNRIQAVKAHANREQTSPRLVAT